MRRQQEERRKERKKEYTISIDQLHIQLPQLPHLVPVGSKHLVPKHMHLEQLAQHAVHEQRSLPVKDVLPRPLLPTTRDPVHVLHQLGGGVRQVKEVEGSLGFGADVGEVVLHPGPSEGFDFQIAGSEVGVWVCDRGLGSLKVRGDDVGFIGVLVVSYGALRAVACSVPSAVSERCLHHDLNGIAWW